MYNFIQPGKSVTYTFRGSLEIDDIDAPRMYGFDEYCIPVEYGAAEGEVVPATEDTTKFAGVIIAQTHKNSLESVRRVLTDYTTVTVLKEGIILGKAKDEIKFGDYVAIGQGLSFKKVTVDNQSPANDNQSPANDNQSPANDNQSPANLLLSIVGIAESDAQDGKPVKVRLL